MLVIVGLSLFVAERGRLQIFSVLQRRLYPRCTQLSHRFLRTRAAPGIPQANRRDALRLKRPNSAGAPSFLANGQIFEAF